MHPPVAAVYDRRFPYADAFSVAQKFVAFLGRHCTRCVIAGSLRRRKQFVSDIEILFVPKIITIDDPGDMFGGKMSISSTEAAITALLNSGTIETRPNKNGVLTWGGQNKLAIHCATGIPVDLFATTEENFWNALVVRTGPADSNKRIASAAIARGWNWHAYGNGFTRGRETKIVKSEREVFEHVGLPYLEPEKR